ncbi:hypothetical protein PC121_g13008 [Phytophthora cactorum]|nr:hypothetical protein PC120_g18347 [Phytophthora cactorum]KAG3061405.1 hypothetical protein PC121_g13008 [Phytophthora cactorum]
MSVVDSSSLLQPALGGAAATSAFTVPPDDNPFAAFAAPTLRLLDDSNSTQQTSRRSLASQPALPSPSPPTPSTRDGRTAIYNQGYQLTRANVTGVKISYRCSFYRKPKLCPGTLVFHADTMTYDFANMVPHTCRNYGGNSAIAQATDDSACLNVVDEMKEFVDKIVEETDNGATKI